jgi:hypothetical protein
METQLQSPTSPATNSAARTRALPLLLCLGSLGLLAGCATEPISHVVSAPPPPPPTKTMTTTTTTTTPNAVVTPVMINGQPGYATTAGVPGVSTTVVTQAPPEMPPEVVVAQPSPQHAWLAGYWTWRNDRYEWMAGHWELPPTSGALWVKPRWESSGTGAYRFYEGYWR